MKVVQKRITLIPRPRGFHLVTGEILKQMPEIGGIVSGVMHVFILHTSASLTVNENASPDVRGDMERHFNVLAPEDAPYYRHTDEGRDDMPAHIKASLLGSSISVPLANGRPLLGTWQGIYLCEHRDQGGPREIVVTALGV